MSQPNPYERIQVDVSYVFRSFFSLLGPDHMIIMRCGGFFFFKKKNSWGAILLLMLIYSLFVWIDYIS